MNTRRLRRLLARLHPDPRPPLAHREALRDELMLEFRARVQPAAPNPWRSARRIVAAIAAATATLLLAAEVGQRIVISDAPAQLDWPSGRALQEALPDLAPGVDARLWAYRTPGDGPLTVLIDLFDAQDAPAIVARLRAAFPALRDARIDVLPLEARARGKLIDLLGHELHYRPAPEAVRKAWLDLERQRGDSHE
jgi:hypothetical protein